MNLQEVIERLSENYKQIKITTGYSDTINGYGWHTKYSVQVFETNEYCEICKTKKGTNHSDDAHRGNHRWRHETACIYSNVHYDIDSIVTQLNLIANDHRPTQRPCAQFDAALLQQRTGYRTNQ